MTDKDLHRIIDLAFLVHDKAPKVTIDMMGINADTTTEELDKVERWLFGLDRFQKETLFATLEAFPVISINELEMRVDEVFDGRWVVYDQIRTPAELGFWLTHDGEYAEEGDDLDDPDAIQQAKELLTEGARYETGTIVSERGYVSLSER